MQADEANLDFGVFSTSGEFPVPEMHVGLVRTTANLGRRRGPFGESFQCRNSGGVVAVVEEMG